MNIIKRLNMEKIRYYFTLTVNFFRALLNMPQVFKFTENGRHFKVTFNRDNTYTVEHQIEHGCTLITRFKDETAMTSYLERRIAE